MRLRHRGTGDAALAQGIDQDHFLLLHLGLRQRKILLPGRYLGLGLYDRNRRKRADLYLFLVILVKLVGQFQGFPDHPDVFVKTHQIPIEILHLRDGLDHLLLKQQVASLPIVAGDVDIA